jgi:hypothetical protein
VEKNDQYRYRTPEKHRQTAEMMAVFVKHHDMLFVGWSYTTPQKHTDTSLQTCGDNSPEIQENRTRLSFFNRIQLQFVFATWRVAQPSQCVKRRPVNYYCYPPDWARYGNTSAINALCIQRADIREP